MEFKVGVFFNSLKEDSITMPQLCVMKHKDVCCPNSECRHTDDVLVRTNKIASRVAQTGNALTSIASITSIRKSNPIYSS